MMTSPNTFLYGVLIFMINIGYYTIYGYGNTSLLVLRVGDGTACPSTTATCTGARGLYVDEYNTNTGGLVGSTAITGVTLSSTDQYVGALSRCGDGSCVVFGGQTVASGTGATTTSPFFTGDRVVVRINSAGTIDTSTKIAQADYNGLFKGVCSFDGTGYFIAGNATTTCVGYVAHGSISGSGNYINIASGSLCQTPEGVMHGLYTGCTAVLYPQTLYFTRTYGSYGFIDVPRADVPVSNFTITNGVQLVGTTTTVLNSGFNNPWYFSQVITNYAQDTWWVIEPHECGIAICRDRSSIPNLPRAANLQSNGCTYLYGGVPGSIPCAFSGVTLSADEQWIYFTSLNVLYRISSQASSVATVVATSAAFYEFRGVALAPQLCSGTGTSPFSGYYCPNGANKGAVPCAKGTYAVLPGAASSCTNCPAGTYLNKYGSTNSNECTSCAAGIYCPAGTANNTVPCPPGYYCAAGAGPVACSAGIYCPAGSTTNTVTCAAGYYCPGVGVGPQACIAGTWSNATGQTTSATCSNCPAGTYSEIAAAPSLSSCLKCPIGTYNPSAGSNSRLACANCAAGFFCPEGSTINTVTCPAGWFCSGGGRETAPCPSGKYSTTVGATSNATCLNCGAGIWCPAGGTNTSLTCRLGYACPGNGAPNYICPPGFYGPNYGGTSCVQCVAGSLSNIYGATSCSICPAGTYSEAGSAALVCSQCPPNTYSPNPGAGSRAFCTPCPLGYSSPAGATACQAMSWTKINPPIPLTGRQGGITAFNTTAVVAVGGRKADGAVSDVSLAYDVFTNQIVESRGIANISFDRAAVAAHPTDGSVYVFGGIDSSGVETSTLWRVNAATNSFPKATQIIPTVQVPAPSARKLAAMGYVNPCPGMSGACLVLMGGEKSGTLLADMWAYDLTANKWSVLPAHPSSPPARSGHAITTLPNSSILYVFGGTTATGVSNDLFALAPFGFYDAIPSEMTNIALKKPAFISENDPFLGNRNASAATDGILTTRHNPITSGDIATCACNWCAMTPTGPAANLYGSSTLGTAVGTTNPWWGVDLGSTQQVDFIYMYMREPAAAGQYVYDFPFGKNAGALLFASNSNSTPAVPCPGSRPFGNINQTACPYSSVGSGCPPGTTASAGGCTVNANLGAEIPVGGPNMYATPNLQTRYIWLVLPGVYRILSICEFQAYQKNPWVWRKLTGTFNAALNKRATQSSTLTGYGDGQAYRAVDGLVANKLDNAQPYTFSHTRDGGDTPFTWWQVDMGTRVDVLSLRIFGRSDCCTGRNLNIKWYIGDSEDYLFNTLCTNSPADITPTTVLTSPNCVSGADVVTTPGAQQTACFVPFTCSVRGRYLQAIKTDANAIMLGEVQVIANKLLDTPSARTGMAVSTFGGNMVLFGGADNSGFRNNEVRFYDMLRNMWLPPFTAIGTPPTARASAFFQLMPSTVYNGASNRFLLTGGYSNTDQLNDVMVLQLPSCPVFDQTIATTVNCYQGGTVCYIVCPGYATAANGNNPVVCQPDGSWRGNFPVCGLPTPTKPLSVAATVDNAGIATVTWGAPSSTGYAGYTIDSYNVKIASNEIYEVFSSGSFPAPISPYNVGGAGWEYVGGNWYSLLPKMGPNTNTGQDPITLACCSATNTATLTLGVANTFDFWNGYLRLGADFWRVNKYDKNDNMVLFRDWPAFIDPAGPWAIETFLSLDTYNIVTAVDHAACLGLVDVSDYGGLGVVEFYACIRNNGAQVYQTFQQSSTNAWTQDLYDTAPFNTAYTKPYAAYMRYEHDPTLYPYSIRAYWKLNIADVWMRFPTPTNQLVMRGGPLNPQNIRPAIMMRNANAQIRGVALFSYFRMGPIQCSEAGAQRFVSNALGSALIYGLTQGTSYQFTVAAHTAAGWGATSDKSNRITIPVRPIVDTLPLLSQNRPCTMNSYYSASLYPCEAAFNGIMNDFAHNNCNADSQGGWIQVDLGSVRSIRMIRVVDRQDCCQTRLNNYQIWVSSNTNFLATGAQCNTAFYNPTISGIAGYAQSFPCYAMGSSSVYLSGQYVTFRRDPNNVDCLNIAELQVFGVADTPLVSQNKPCTMQSALGINTCAFALDGRLDTFAQNNNNAPLVQPYGWLTVDLGVSTVISSIRMYARPDTFADSLDNFKMWVGDLPTFYSTTNINLRNAPCNQSYLPASIKTLPGNVSTFQCINNDGFGYKTNAPQIGRYVTVQFVKGASFSLTELQVFSSNLVLASYNKPCFMSSTYNPYRCNNAFNNIFDDFAHTNADLDNYITVDLGFSTAVRAIKITNRRDCCQTRLNNFEMYVGDSSNYHQNIKCDPTNIPSTWTETNGWVNAFACILTGRYVTMHIPTDYMNVAEIQVYAANACPIRTATGATQLGGSVCAGAGWGQVCTHVCNTGWVPVSGSTSSTCNGQVWDAPALVCAPPCADLIAPQFSETCSQTYFVETFNSDGALTRFVSLDPYTQKTGIPTDSPPQGTKWFQLDGMLQSSSLVTCSADLHLVISSKRIYDWSSGFTLAARISTTSRAGLVFRAIDKTNLLRFYYDAERKYAAIERVVNGIPFIISQVWNYLLTPDVFHSVSVTVLNSQINVTFDGNLLMSTSDKTFLVGYAGVYAQSSALFDDLTHSVACNSMCTGMTDGSTCTFSCSEGLIAIGPLTRSCVGTTSISTMVFSPDLVTQPLICTLPAPTFVPATLYILENSAKNANVGDPLVAFSSSPDYQVQFQILSVYQMSAYKINNFNASIIDNQGLFWVDACSGQVKLRSGGKDVMDYEGVNNYIITVRVFVSGFVGAETIRNVTVIVLNVDEPPIALATAVSIPENSAITAKGEVIVWNSLANYVAGTMAQWDPENTTITFKLTVDGADGKFILNSTTGVVAVPATASVNGTTSNSTNSLVNLNYETLPNTFILSVTVSQVNDTSMFSTSSFTVSLIDMNDAPMITRNQVLSISEYADIANPSSAEYPLLAGLVVSFDEDINATWNNGTIYSLLTGSSATTSCGQTSSWPSIDGTSTNTQLFTIDPVTGGIMLVAMPTTNWRSRTPVVISNQLVRASYKVCVKALDVGGAYDIQPVTINVLADLPSTPYISLVSGLTPNPPTAGSTLITFTGANFRPGGSIRPVTATYASVATGVVYTATGCQTISDTAITCYTVPGFGANYEWSVYLDGNLLSSVPTLSMTYDFPVVTSVSSSGQNMSTTGNVVVTFYGDNFGPNPSQNSRASGYIYNYSNPSLYVGNNGNELVCAPYFYNYTVYQCIMPAGVGKDLSWTINVGENSFSVTAAGPSSLLLSYAIPTITSITGGDVSVNVNKLDTVGGQKVIITGMNFGPAKINWRTDKIDHTLFEVNSVYAQTYVQYSNSYTTSAPLQFFGCTQGAATAHTQITCYTVPGAGIGHETIVSIAGQQSVAFSGNGGLSYAAPELTSIRGTGDNSNNIFDTTGGQTVKLYGRHFGPISTPSLNYIDEVKYGHPGDTGRYTIIKPQDAVKACTVTLQTPTVSEMTCLTLPGVGRGLVWNVTIGSQDAIVQGAALTTSYAAPQVFTFTGAGAFNADTNGGEPVIITGRNFGPGDTYTNALLKVNYGVVLEQGGAEFLSVIPFVRYIAATCTITIAHTQLTCYTVEGAGTGMDWKVSVDSQESSNPTTNYHAPEIYTITYVGGAPVTAADVNGGEVIILNGNYFGPPIYGSTSRSLLQKVTYGPVGSEFIATNCTVLTESTIKVVLPPGIGENLHFIVQIADQLSAQSTGTFSYAKPMITLVDPNRAGTYSSISSPTVITVLTRNLPLLDRTTIYRVVLGQGAVAVTRDISLPVGSLNAIASRKNADGTINGTFTLPQDGAGYGLGVTINVYQGSLSSLAATTNVKNDASVFSYNDPTITTVVVTRALFYTPGNESANLGGDFIACPSWSAPWDCSDPTIYQLTILGSNFGADPLTMDHNDGVIRKVEILKVNYTALGIPVLGEIWSTGSPGAPTDNKYDMIYLYSWSHNEIIAFVHGTSGKLRVSLTTQSTWLNTTGANEMQSVIYDYANLNPTISNIVDGSIPDVPTTGGVDPITFTIDGLAGTVDLKIFVGGDHTTGTEAIIVCPPTGVNPSPLVPCPNVQTEIINKAPSGSSSVTFYPPPGQGIYQPIIVVTYLYGNIPKRSTESVHLNYIAPVLTKFSVKLPTDVTWPTPTDISPVTNPVVFVPTDGNARVRLIGTNLGTAPEVFMGDRFIIPANSITRCDPPGQNHTCIEFTPLAGEGDGTYISDFMYPKRLLPPFGFTMEVWSPYSVPAHAQKSNAVKMSYMAPVITAVTSPSGSFPTEGGTTVMITGTNFGVSAYDINTVVPDINGPFGIKVTFNNLGNAGDDLYCTDINRISHTLINCTLPEGGGGKLKVSVSVAGVSGTSATTLFGYDKPVIVSSYVLPKSFAIDPLDPLATVSSASAMNGVVVQPGVNSNSVELQADTDGGDYIVLEGTSFGKLDPSNCAFMTWWNRDSSIDLLCNNLEDFLGEGEVSASQVVYWSHRLVIFSTNIGIGYKQIALSVRGNFLALTPKSPNAVRFTYNTPSLEWLSPNLGPTEGTENGKPVYITLRGQNFGPRPYDLSKSKFIYPKPLSMAPLAPTAYLVVVFHSSCVADPYEIDGALNRDLSVRTENKFLPLYSPMVDEGCIQNSLSVINSSAISISLPAGVGANKNVSVIVVDANETALAVQSNKLKFAYKPPVISGFEPTPVIVYWNYDSNTEEFVPTPRDITVKGNDFGNSELAIKQSWSEDERRLGLTIGGTSCIEGTDKLGQSVFTGLKRTREPGVFDAFGVMTSLPATVVKCDLDLRIIPAGVSNVTINIAGQSYTAPSWKPINSNDTNVPRGLFIVGCGPGSYAHIGELCRVCPAQYLGTGLLPGARCDGYIDNSKVPFLERFPYPRPTKGWYNLNSSDANTRKWGNPDGTQMTACPPGFQDDGRDVCIVPCDPPESCLADNICSYGYASKPPTWKCTSCDVGFYHQGYTCVKCPDSPYALVIGFVLLVIFAGCVGYFLNQKGVNIAVIGIGIDFFQVLAIFATSGVKWPPVVKELLHVLSAFNLNIEIVAPECIVPDLSYKQKFWFIMLLPLSVGGFLLGGVWVSLFVYKAYIMGQSKTQRISHTPALISSVLSLLYILYLYLTRTIFDVFTCTPTYPPDGRLYLNVANKEQCGIPGGTQLTLLPYAVAGLVVYSFGYPAFVTYLLVKNRELVMLDQVLRAKGTGEDRLTNPHAFDLRSKYSRTYFQFKPDWCMWTLAVVLRKFFIAITAVVFSKNSSFQMAACLLVMFLAYSAQVMVRPYMGPAEFEDVIKSVTESSFTSAIHARIRSQIASIESRGRKKARKNLLNFEGKVQTTAVLGLLTSWLFNYNTVEQIMIFCAVIVCLMGIMYQANQASSFYPGALDGVTAVVMIAIIFAIVYYVAVITTEIVILYNEESARKRAKLMATRGIGGAKATSSPDKQIGSMGGRLVGSDGEINTGKVDTQMNPLFMNKEGTIDTSSATGGVEFIMNQRTPPTPEMWVLIQQGYADLHRQLEAMSGRLAEAKKREQLGLNDSENSGSQMDDMTSSPIAVATKKKSFAPKGTDGNDSSKPMRNKQMQSFKSARQSNTNV